MVRLTINSRKVQNNVKFRSTNQYKLKNKQTKPNIIYIKSFFTKNILQYSSISSYNSTLKYKNPL